MPTIKFQTEAQRLAHPQARLIPKIMWETDPYDVRRPRNEQPTFIFDFMQLTNDELIARINEAKLWCFYRSGFVTDHITTHRKNLTWVAMAVSHPTLSNKQLLDMSTQLGLNIQDLFKSACLFGNLKFLRFISSQLPPQEITDVFKHYMRMDLFKNAASEARYLPVLKFLLEKNREINNEDYLKDYHFSEIIESAAMHGNLIGLKYLLSKTSEANIDELANSPGGFLRHAVKSGDLAILKYLFAQFPQWRKNSVFMMELFKSAAENGHLAALEYIVATAKSPIFPGKSDDLDEETATNYSKLFEKTVANGHLPVMEYLMKQHPQQCIIKLFNKLSLLNSPASEGNLPLIKFLIDEDSQLHGFNIYEALMRTAYDGGHWPIIEYLIDNQSKYLEKATDKQYVTFFSYVAHDERLRKRLIDLRPLLFKEDTPYLEAFYWAAHNNDLATMEYLVATKPNILNIRDSGFEGSLPEFARQGHLAIVQYFIAKVPPTESDIGNAAVEAMRYNELDTANYLLSFTAGLIYADAHEENKHYFYPYIDRLVSHLHDQKTKFEQEQPNTVFNEVNPEQAKIYLCCLRNLIRRNDPALLNEMVFLLDIPAVKALAHTSVEPNRPNELLRLALSLSNEGAARLLLNVPAVHALAEQNEFYRNEAQGQFNLENLARDRESSMLALSPGEQKRMKRVEDLYSAEMKAKGVPGLMEELKTTLMARYSKNPAFIMQIKKGKEQRLNLPMQWNDFQKLKLSPDEQQLALTAYYKNKDHGVFRYLSKPNPWMHARASYVNVNPENTAERWSTFNEYEPLIALLYLAAKDDNKQMVMDGYTSETRFDQFIDELHHINRAHNWDKTRINAKGISEEYDDGEGDRPSCFSGVKRRLFQSVVGHPLLNLVTLQTIKMELRDFVRSHFKEAIKKGNPEQICQDMKDYYIVMELTEPLKQLDISVEQQQEFIKSLKDKYKEQFTDDPTFTDYVEKQFKLNKSDAHALSFNHFKWTQFLPGWVEATPAPVPEPAPEHVEKPATVVVPEAAATPPGLSRPIILPERVKAEKPKLTPINITLPKAAFLELLGTLENKQKNYLCNYIDADVETDLMLFTLKEAADSFYDHPMTEESFKEFKKSCDIALSPENRVALDEHRQHFGAFFTAIKNFFIALKQAIFNEPGGSVRFWDTRTQTTKMVAELDEDIQKRVNPLNKNP